MPNALFRQLRHDMLRARSCGHSPLISSPAPVVPSVSSASASLVLRPAAAPDLVEIRALLVETWHDTYDPLFGYEEVASFTDRLHAVEKLAGELGRASHVFLVAEREDGLAGTVSATLGGARGVPDRSGGEARGGTRQRQRASLL